MQTSAYINIIKSIYIYKAIFIFYFTYYVRIKNLRQDIQRIIFISNTIRRRRINFKLNDKRDSSNIFTRSCKGCDRYILPSEARKLFSTKLPRQPDVARIVLQSPEPVLCPEHMSSNDKTPDTSPREIFTAPGL